LNSGLKEKASENEAMAGERTRISKKRKRSLLKKCNETVELYNADIYIAVRRKDYLMALVSEPQSRPPSTKSAPHDGDPQTARSRITGASRQWSVLIRKWFEHRGSIALNRIVAFLETHTIRKRVISERNILPGP